MRRKYLGQCHCGKVTFAVEADLEAGPNLICNCTSCSMKGFIHHHVERSEFRLLTGYSELKLYKFGTLSAEHYFCTHCGVESFYRSRSDPNMWDINLRCLRDAGTRELVDIYALRYQMNDGMFWEDSEAVMAAREKRERETGIPSPVRLWRLVAPDDRIDPKLDVASQFRKTWDDAAL